MYKYVIRSTIFIVVITLSIYTYTTVIKYAQICYHGINTEQQINKSFELSISNTYDCVALGNSRIYRGVNPEYLQMSTFNFAHDNDSFNQAYYKLKFLNNNNIHVKRIILGVDYFQFSFLADSRNFAYNKLGKDYYKDYPNNNLFHFTNEEQFNRKIINIFQTGFIDLIRFAKGEKRKDINYIKNNGQYIINPNAKGKETDKVKRSTNRLPIQIKYFSKIIDFCRKEQIQLILVMPPCRQVELGNYTSAQKIEFDQFISTYIDNKNVYYFNLSQTGQFDDIEDFMDVTHLNKAGADKFSHLLNDIISKNCNGLDISE